MYSQLKAAFTLQHRENVQKDSTHLYECTEKNAWHASGVIHIVNGTQIRQKYARFPYGIYAQQRM